jgi:hypothetical protein
MDLDAVLEGRDEDATNTTTETEDFDEIDQVEAGSSMNSRSH